MVPIPSQCSMLVYLPYVRRLSIFTLYGYDNSWTVVPTKNLSLYSERAHMVSYTHSMQYFVLSDIFKEVWPFLPYMGTVTHKPLNLQQYWVHILKDHISYPIPTQYNILVSLPYLGRYEHFYLIWAWQLINRWTYTNFEFIFWKDTYDFLYPFKTIFCSICHI